MLRTALIAALALLLLPASAPRRPRRGSVTLTGCTPKERTVAFEARMDQISGAVRMKLRYTLEARKPRRVWHRVAAPELGSWRAASTETTRFISERRVTQLSGRRTTARWCASAGSTRTATCRPRPAALARLLAARPPAQPQAARALVRGQGLLRRAGRQHRPQPDRRLRPGDHRPAADRRPELAPGEERLIEAAGPECQPGTPVTATADPLDLIDERNERDNAVTRRCPSARAS